MSEIANFKRILAYFIFLKFCYTKSKIIFDVQSHLKNILESSEFKQR
ncbi:hypothetical protein LEP1GSC170_4242 [Leptospira interrogans serovar Bataviae str. HAI135]|nr:hypothetical protein LEP1GSC170_4242 [Leptospira interrogans serovar Bataviae str. HAI135]